MALQTLSEATPTEAIHWPDVLQRAARAMWQHMVEIDDCSRQNSAYRPTHFFVKYRYSIFIWLESASVSYGSAPFFRAGIIAGSSRED